MFVRSVRNIMGTHMPTYKPACLLGKLVGL